MILHPFPSDWNPQEIKNAEELYAKIQEKLNQLGRVYKEDIDFNKFVELNSPVPVKLVELNTDYSSYKMAIRSSIKRPTVFLKRSTNSSFINPYNRKLLEAWEANLDIQFILDIYSSLDQDVRRGNIAIKDKLKKFASILINGSEISAQEAAAFLLGISNTNCSRSDVFINTAEPEERITFLKPKEELNELGDDSEDICMKGLNDHYSQRPKELEDICLAEFASMYNFTASQKKKEKESQAAGDFNLESEIDDDVEDNPNPIIDDTIRYDSDTFLGSQANTSLPSTSFISSQVSTPNKGRKAAEKHELLDGSGTVHKRTIRKIIRFRHYGKQADPTNYFREQLMLFVPWRDEKKDLIDIDKLSTALTHQDQLKLNSQPFYFNHDVDDELLQGLLEDAEVRQLEQEDDQPMVENDKGVEAEDYFNDFNVDDFTPTTSKVERFLPPRLTGKVPFQDFLSGGAGVGKSHVVTAIVQSFMRYCSKFPNVNPDQLCVLVAAPTGKAAFNVFGMTLHCTFRLPPTQSAGGLGDLQSGILNTLRIRLEGVKLFIIDEISMVSVKQLYDIDQRLRQIYETAEPFGGKSFVVVGHLRQLPPIGGSYVFKPPTHIPRGAVVGNHLWELFQLYELTEIMRQRDEWEFCKALNNMAEGIMDEDDIALIKSREVTPQNQPPDTGIRLYKTNAECQEYNSEVHAKLSSDGAMSTAHDKIQGSASEADKKRLLEYATTLTAQQSDGLPYQTYLKVGAEYFVGTNVDVQDGLFNVRASTRPYQVRKNIDEELVAVDRITRNLSKTGRHQGLQIIRTQIPLVPANGTTIAKSQGSTHICSVVAVKCYCDDDEPPRKRSRKNWWSREELYVACSRPTSREGLFIYGEFTPPLTPGPNDPVSIEMARLRSTEFTFSMKFLQDYRDEFEKIYFQNTQSFNAHGDDIRADHCAMASNVLAFVEPWLLPQDLLDVPGFHYIYRKNCSGPNRNSEGALIMEKISVNQSTNIPLLHVDKTEYSKSRFLAKLDEILNQLNGKVLIFGDANINLSKWEGRGLLELFSTKNCTSKLPIQEPSTDYGTHIDICFSNVDEIEAWFYESYFS
ncbi:ATP-dependent DNA helicase pif1 [Folsomia candida]|uniref:ATP-dependent DNA helicase n=1 Tax=Folsomia candida TaxID=158441 RepID=A0A226DBZ4_FOLCA|nr:ATP-dependent DNA helicase pif1 [Folsomia candida]